MREKPYRAPLAVDTQLVPRNPHSNPNGNRNPNLNPNATLTR